MADDNTVEISFTASTEDALDGIAQIRQGLAGLTASVSGMNSSVGRLGDGISAALSAGQLSGCAKAFGDMAAAAQQSALQVRQIGTETSFCSRSSPGRKSCSMPKSASIRSPRIKNTPFSKRKRKRNMKPSARS